MAEGDLKVHGKEYDPNDLTFREEREVRTLVKQLNDGADVDFEDVPFGDILPALCYVLRRRDDPEFSMEQALDLKYREVVVGAEEGKTPRPTRPGSSSKKPKPGASGPQK